MKLNKKLINYCVFFFILGVYIVLGDSGICEVRSSVGLGGKCKFYDFKCDYTMFCNSKNKCQQQLELGGKCKKDSQCYGNYGFKLSVGNMCQLELKNGEKCGMDHTFCTNGTVCINGFCKLKCGCKSDSECPFNQ
ncbi:hypothetical protein DICPUDRAFT_80733 [Dictyostelium purpureum]|uniref:Dickkopf N-terminal cysteine-rich domain-containing protein n=1 Tax=Dictyostelium purpureum TaxID=5786 RepID=F0ZRD1_DICPU|nr:uncharacterized protein DICPUDRAFT_80733 [Dictyostelium purpureum]EGC33494.1 hypothetical protein DICPUDRAFT_80733 [Dictyostelium purpureum]|eukprot:XP_003289968.1 hypothetical protein DICPUDRAFT_80733 [Dictyostelium purpureum]